MASFNNLEIRINTSIFSSSKENKNINLNETKPKKINTKNKKYKIQKKMNLSYHMLNLKNYIKQERIDVCNQLWKKFDKGNTGFINEKDLGTMLRLLEYNPTERELIEMKEMLKSVNPQEDPDKISKEGFFACVARKERDTDSKEELENCFKIWDPQNSGLIEEKLFRYMMCKMGDTFTNEEIYALFKEQKKE